MLGVGISLTNIAVHGGRVSGADPLAPTAPVLTYTASDTGSSSSDGITKTTTLTFNIDFPGTVVAGDILNGYKNGVASPNSPITLTSNQIAGIDPVDFGWGAQSDGVYANYVTVSHSGHVSAPSNTVTVMIDNTAPSITSANSISKAEGSNVVITATATDAGGLAASPWALSGTDAALLSINAVTGAITKATGNFDFETKTSFSFNILCSDLAGNQATQAFTLTITNVVEDTTPSAFTFTDATNVALSTLSTSDAITVAGVDGACDLVVTGTAASKEYQINAGAWTSAAVTGSVVSGDTVKVRGTSDGTNSVTTSIIVSIGGNVTSATTDTYTITTVALVSERDFATMQGYVASYQARSYALAGKYIVELPG